MHLKIINNDLHDYITKTFKPVSALIQLIILV